MIMKSKSILFALFTSSLLAVGQQMHNNATGDYKHPQLAEKAAEMQKATAANDTNTYVVEFVQNLNYKDQTNNSLKIKSTRKRKPATPQTTALPKQNSDYKHPQGLH
jgi:hypothetical protein